MRKLFAIGAMVLGLGACSPFLPQVYIQDGSVICTVTLDDGTKVQTGPKEANDLIGASENASVVCVG